MNAALLGLDAAELIRLGGLKITCSAPVFCAEHTNPHPCDLCDLEGRVAVACTACHFEFAEGLNHCHERACQSMAAFVASGRIAFETEALAAIKKKEEEIASGQKRRMREIEKQEAKRKKAAREEAARKAVETSVPPTTPAAKEKEVRADRLAAGSGWAGFLAAVVGGYMQWHGPMVDLADRNMAVLGVFIICLLCVFAVGNLALIGTELAHRTLRGWSPLCWAFMNFAWPGIAALAATRVFSENKDGLQYILNVLLAVGIIYAAAKAIAYGGVSLTMSAPWPRAFLSDHFGGLRSYIVWFALIATLGVNLATWNSSHNFPEKVRAATSNIEVSIADAIKSVLADVDYRIGLEYETGVVLKQSFDRAAKWYLKAAEQGNSEAQYALGLMYQTGKGVEINEQEAKKWNSMAAQQGHSRAQANLLRIYLKNKEIDLVNEVPTEALVDENETSTRGVGDRGEANTNDRIAFLEPLPWLEDSVPELSEVVQVAMLTTAGPILIEVYPQAAPNAAERFLRLTTLKYYKDTSFLRVVPGFAAQFGINESGLFSNWADYYFEDDPTYFSHERGTLAFAKSGFNTNATQVFINLGLNNHLAAQNLNYTVFGKVVVGMDVVEQFVKIGEPKVSLIGGEGSYYLGGTSKKPTSILSTSMLDNGLTWVQWLEAIEARAATKEVASSGTNLLEDSAEDSLEGVQSENGGVSNTDIVDPPALREFSQPEYPRQALRRGLEGTVILRLYIDVNGIVDRYAIVESSGHEILDIAAGEHAKRNWWYWAQTRNGVPENAEVISQPIKFVLED
jgi:TonB family protein